MTDQTTEDGDARMDVRLRESGERWRDAHSESAPAIAAGGSPPRRPWLLVASAAVVIAALVAGGITLWGGTSSDSERGGSNRSTGASAGGGSIDTGTWHARSVLPVARNGNRPPDHDQPLAAPAFLRFRDGGFVGSDGCNTISGPAAVHADTITFGDVASTEIACTGGATSNAAVMVAILHGTAQYSVTSSELVIVRPGTGSLYLSRDARPKVSSPVGAWLVTGSQIEHDDGDGTGSGGGVSISPTKDGTRLVIDPAGTFSVSRCPRLRGRFTLRGDELVLRAVQHLNGPYCGSPAETFDKPLTTVLTGTTTWQIDGDQLTITRGSRSVIFARAR